MQHCKSLALAVTFLTLSAVSAFAGNGAPNGAHYNLNIIGVSNPKTADMSNSNGHVIFVALGGKDDGTVRTKIILTEGPFAVTDKNGTDGEAGFQLPVSNVDCPVDAELDDPCQLSGDYAVFIRGLGKPGGQAWITTCFEEGGIEYCSVETVHVEAHVTVGTGNKPAKFVNVTKELTTVCLDTDDPPDGFCDVREQLFSRALAEYYWNYDNNGLRLAQLRFYEIP